MNIINKLYYTKNKGSFQLLLLLEEYIKAMTANGKSESDVLMDLYKKGIISKNIVKNRLKIDEYEFLYMLTSNKV